MTEDKQNLWMKISAMRKEFVSLDWKKDGFVAFGKSNFNYLSTDKIKANLAPIFAKHNLDLNIVFREPTKLDAVGAMSQHWMVTLDATIVDLESGESITDTVFGEAADSGDKALGKAMTYAVKAWASQKFLIADGMDPDAAEVGGSSFRPKTVTETEEVRSKVLEQGVKPPAPAPAPVPKAPAPAPKAPKAPETPKAPEAPKAPEPEVQPMEGQPAQFKVSAAQQKAIKKVTDAWEEAAKNGKVEVEEYNRMLSAATDIASTQDAMNFVNDFKRSF